jgi:predicted amidohydrolase YtcJ
MVLNSKGGDITIINARIWTGDPGAPWANALTVRGGKIAAMDAAQPAGKVIDAEGRLVVPGFWDSHCHPQTPYVLTSPEAPSLFKCKKPTEVLNTLRKYLEQHPQDKYPRLFGWRNTIFKQGQKPTRQMIDEIVPDRPVYLVDYSGHAHWANTKALKLAGIFEKDPTGIPYTSYTIERDEKGLATGYMRETELGSTHGFMLNSVKKLKPLTFEEQVMYQRLILEEYPKVGVTSIWTKDGDNEITRIYEQILRNDVLPVRAILDNLYSPFSGKDDIKLYARWAKQLENSGLPKGFLRADGIKIMVDLAYTAWMFDPYNIDPTKPNYCGKPVYEDMKELERQVFEADKLGLHVNLLAIGDRAVHEGLNVLDRMMKANPLRKRRHTLEHAEYVIDMDLARLKKLEVTASMNPFFSYPDETYISEMERVMGKERLKKLFQRWKDMMAAGAMVVQGSDFPLSPMDPMICIHIMVTGTDIYGNPPGGLWPHKNVTVEAALRSYTVDAAYAAFKEKRGGRLKPGYDADFVMLSENILDHNFQLTRLAWVKVNLTVFNGHILYKDFSNKEKKIKFFED